MGGYGRAGSDDSRKKEGSDTAEIASVLEKREKRAWLIGRRRGQEDMSGRRRL